MYGFAKLTGAQFTVLDSELDKPLREVSGFWLTWYYFGFSAVYSTIIAGVQIAGAVGLLVRRTALIAALSLLPVVGNIILIDILYRIDFGALAAALLIAACLIRIVGAHLKRLLHLLLPAPPARTGSARTVTLLLCTTIITIPLVSTYFIANYITRLPTPIDGTWVVRGTAPEGQTPTHIYFERNRAYMCVFRNNNARSTHHFEYEPRQSRIVIWDRWLTKGPLLFEGTYHPIDSSIQLVGRLPGSAEPVTLRLSKLRPPS
jgi:hypothetical protein